MIVKKLGTVVLAAAAFLCMGSADAAAYTRACSAAYELVPAVGGYETVSVANFSATGSCGWGVWDRCRRRARDAANACMTKHNTNFSSNDMPTECNESLSNVNNYSVTNLEVYLKKVICETYRDPAQPITVRINSVTSGDTGCGSRAKLRDMNIQCPAI